jgi:CBS domain-containing protein
MTENPTTISPRDSVLEAIRTLEQLAIRHLPVIDDAGELVGMLSDRDLRGEISPRVTAGDVMNTNVVQALADDELTVIADLIVDNGVGAIPICDERGLLVGIVSYVDILRSLSAIENAGSHAPKRKAATH